MSLKESEERYRTLFDNSRNAINIFPKDRKFLDVNKKLVQLSGYSKKQLLSMKLEDLFPEAVKPAIKERIKKMLQGEELPVFETYLLTKKGKRIPVEIGVTALKNCYRQKVVFQGNIRDITERKHAEKKLLAYQEQLRSLASELSLTEEKERRRIATHLHDHIGHALAMCKLKLGPLRNPLSPTDQAKYLDEIHELIDQAIQCTRSLTFELSPPVLHELGLEAAVQWLVERIRERHDIMIQFEDDGQLKLLDDEVKVLLFQATRELLANIVKHAQTRNAKISTRRNYDNIRINVKDEGIGFDTHEIFSNIKRNGGFGLFNIHERLNHIGGHLEIQSIPGHGTQVTMVAPLRTAEEVNT